MRGKTAFRLSIGVTMVALFFFACQPGVPFPMPSSSPPPVTGTPANTPRSTPTLTPTFPAGCPDVEGKIETLEVGGDVLPKPLRVRVYLPPCFNAGRADPYPLLILLHGQGYDESQWDELLNIDSLISEKIVAGTIQPFTILMPFEEYPYQDPDQSFFPQALTEVLLPWAEDTLNASSSRLCHAIGGISRGAAWAVHLGYLNWQSFSIIGAHSLPPFPGDLVLPPVWKQNIPTDQMPVLAIDAGEFDAYLGYARQFHEVLLEYEIPHEWNISSGGHDDAYWLAHVEEYADWYSEQMADSCLP